MCLVNCNRHYSYSSWTKSSVLSRKVNRVTCLAMPPQVSTSKRVYHNPGECEVSYAQQCSGLGNLHIPQCTRGREIPALELNMGV